MARPRNPVPSYRLHKQSGQAVVTLTLNGVRKDILLGPHGSPESKEEYERVLAQLRTPAGAAGLVAHGGHNGPADLTVSEVLLPFWEHAQKHYRRPDGTPNGTPTNTVVEYRYTLRVLRELYGSLPAREFGPLALKAVRQKMVDLGWCRTTVNSRVGKVKHVFKWATGEELVPPGVYQALACVPGLQRGRTTAPEPDPVVPVPDEHVDAVLPFLNRHCRAMVELMRLTGMRPGEVCRLKLCDVDRSGDVWLYRPAAHKTAHRGKDRLVPIGPRAQGLIDDFLRVSPVDPALTVFSPARERKERFRVRRAARKSKVQPSQQDRRKSNPRRAPAAVYAPHALGVVVARACERARVEHWHPNQLRHTHATRVRREFGLEAAQVVLGHARADVTQVYAERDAGLAVTVAAKIG
jgi:integrase